MESKNLVVNNSKHDNTISIDSTNVYEENIHFGSMKY